MTSSGIQAIAESRDGIVIGTRIELVNQARPGIAVRQGQIRAADARHAEPLTGAGHEQAASLPKLISSFSFERFDGRGNRTSIFGYRMALQEILQRDKRALSVPKSHVFAVRHHRELTTGDKLGKSPCGSHRRAAAAIDVVLRAAKNQCRHFDFRCVAESIPGAPRFEMIAMLLRARLSLPKRVRKRLHDFRMLSIKFFVEGHVRVLDMAADEALEAVRANLLFVRIAPFTRRAARRFHARAGGGDRQRRNKFRPFDSERLNDLPAERKTCRGTARSRRLAGAPLKGSTR